MTEIAIVPDVPFLLPQNSLGMALSGIAFLFPERIVFHSLKVSGSQHTSFEWVYVSTEFFPVCQ